MKTFLDRYFGDQKEGSRKVRFSCLSQCLIAVFAALALVSCMFVPNEDSRQDKNKPVFFQGGVLNANEKVTIEARNPVTKAWQPIPGGETYAGNKLWTWQEHSAYLWSISLPIPLQYWKESQKCASVGESALVRSKGGSSGYLMSFKAGGVYCMLQKPKTFLTDCKAPQSPAVHIGGQDFRDFGKECFETINAIRAEESKRFAEKNKLNPGDPPKYPPLTRKVEEECCTDNNSKLDAECDCHYKPKPCPYLRSNRCPLWSWSIDGMLQTCIWDQMYECEKKLYEEGICDIKYCKVCPYPYTAHYDNMVLSPDVKSVACGIYESSDGEFASTQNFY